MSRDEVTGRALLGLQAGFQDYILGRDDRALAQVESTPALSAERRLDIYHNAYRARLVELLADTYERLVHYIGDDSFDAAARAYIETHLPTARNLRDYGGDFPAFLAWYFPNDPEVAELAEMDLRLRNCFDAADAKPLRLSDLATVRPEEWGAKVFALHPSASFQAFNWNAPAIWQSLNEDCAPPAAERLPQPFVWLFWRKELQPHFRSLSDKETTALQAISKGQTFGEVCAALAHAHPVLDVAPQIALWLRAWLDDGVLLDEMGRPPVRGRR
jgi:hypothetical protein